MPLTAPWLATCPQGNSTTLQACPADLTPTTTALPCLLHTWGRWICRHRTSPTPQATTSALSRTTQCTAPRPESTDPCTGTSQTSPGKSRTTTMFITIVYLLAPSKMLRATTLSTQTGSQKGPPCDDQNPSSLSKLHCMIDGHHLDTYNGSVKKFFTAQ
ncbi:hypothetical protein EGW08_005603 [Elysia chlorotica]|uniref:Uncharacterized protein n=1 Tax=Elysia chlorotica TaxID=188477 RepID=A0A433TYJ4_ELYCH|nr:hypothetical protein EGW08_005603 [Elysia chlorotica]